MDHYRKILSEICQEESSEYISNHISSTKNDDLLQVMLEKDNDKNDKEEEEE